MYFILEKIEPTTLFVGPVDPILQFTANYRAHQPPLCALAPLTMGSYTTNRPSKGGYHCQLLKSVLVLALFLSLTMIPTAEAVGSPSSTNDAAAHVVDTALDAAPEFRAIVSKAKDAFATATQGATEVRQERDALTLEREYGNLGYFAEQMARVRQFAANLQLREFEKDEFAAGTAFHTATVHAARVQAEAAKRMADDLVTQAEGATDELVQQAIAVSELKSIELAHARVMAATYEKHVADRLLAHVHYEAQWKGKIANSAWDNRVTKMLNSADRIATRRAEYATSMGNKMTEAQARVATASAPLLLLHEIEVSTTAHAQQVADDLVETRRVVVEKLSVQGENKPSKQRIY